MSDNIVQVELDEEIEGNQVGSRNYRFSRIGEPVPIKPDHDSVFDPDDPPIQPLAVSQRFRLVFTAHSDGFCVSRTKDVMVSAEEIKEKGEGQSLIELSLVDVPVGRVSILALCADESTLVAAVGNQLNFFSISALLYKEQKPSFSLSMDDTSCIKDFRWGRNGLKDYVVLLSTGKLYRGYGQDSPKEIMDNVDAVEWSTRGNFVAVARKNVLIIMSSSFEEKRSILISTASLRVDTIRWVRSDCIILGCFQLSDDGQIENYFVQVITNKNGNIAEPSSKPQVLSFNDVFMAYDPEAVPSASDAQLLLSYLDHQELAFIANRKNLDQHVVLFGWSLDNEEKEAAVVEILNDAWCPKIDAKGNGDDNLILGLSVDFMSQNENVKLLLGEEEKEVSPCCVLLCLTMDAKLFLFHFASANGPSSVLAGSGEEQNTFHLLSPDQGLSDISSGIRDQSVKVLSGSDSQKSREIDLNTASNLPVNNDQQLSPAVSNKLLDKSIAINQEEKPGINLPLSGHEQQQSISALKMNQDKDRELTSFTGKQGANFGFSTSKTSELKGSLPLARDFSKTDLQSTFSSSGKFSTDVAVPSTGKIPVLGNGMESSVKTDPSNIQSVPSLSWSSGNLSSSKPSDERSLPQLSGKHLNNSVRTFPGSAVQQPSYLKENAGSPALVDSSGRKTMNAMGNKETLSPFPSSQLRVQEREPSNSKSLFSKERLPESNLPKQFHSVEEMAKKLDYLLEAIERPGGFKDASIDSQRSSVKALEDGIWTLSERCRMWKGLMDERQRDIQLLLDKTVEVLARKSYLEGILKQSTDNQYWDLWSRQKLSSELESKRRHILNTYQDLTNELIELERHFNNIELNKFGAAGGSQPDRRNLQSRLGQPRHIQSLHTLHNTMNAQLTAAEKLSECLSNQMAVLSIKSPPKRQSIKKELFETIGLSYDSTSYSSPVKEKAHSNKDLLVTSSSIKAKEKSMRKQTSPTKIVDPETARRRRDSLDQTWASFEPAKTTVKRVLLQDKPKLSANKLSLSGNDNALRESVVTHPKPSSASSTSYHLKNRGISATLLHEPKETPSSLFPWADGYVESAEQGFSECPRPVSQSTPLNSQRSVAESFASTGENSNNNYSFNWKSNSLDATEFKFEQSAPHSSYKPSISVYGQALTSHKNANEVKKLNDKDLEPKLVVGKVTDTPSGTKTSLPQLEGSFKFPLTPAPTGNPSSSTPGKLSPFEIEVSQGRQGGTNSPSASLPMNIKLAASPSSTLSTPVMSMDRISSTYSVNMTASQQASQSQCSVSSTTTPTTLSSTLLKDGLPVTKSLPAFASSESLATVSQPTVVTFGSKGEANSTVQTSVKSAIEVKEKTTASTSKLPKDASDLEVRPPVSPTPATESLPTSNSSSALNLGSVSGPAKDMDLNLKSEAPLPNAASSTVQLSSSTLTGAKFGGLDAVTQEDEMEEEAPETNQTTELTLGGFGGFGLGSVSNTTTAKPNPFGVGVLDKPANPASSPFTMAAPSGELFRPASFSFQSPQTSQPSEPKSFVGFSGGFGGTVASQVPSGRGFGQPAQVGSGQQALGSVLGSFGQSRQIGSSPPASGVAMGGGFGSGFMTNNSASGFGGGFAGVGSAGGGFANLATGGGGFAAAASPGSGFAGAAASGGGFAAAATSGGGFAAAATSGGGFAAAATNPGGGFAAGPAGAFPGGGFGAFGNQQGGGGGFSAFGSGSAAGRPPSELFTQMRK